MEFVCYHEWNQLPNSADSLFARASKDSIFFSRHWFENLIRNSPDNCQNILLACVVEDGNVLAILPLEMRSRDHWYALTNLYSSLYTLLLDERRPQEITECLAQGLVKRKFSLLRLDPVAEDDRNLHYLQLAMESLGVGCHRKFRFYNWIHHTWGQAFTEYMQARPARVRNTIARKARKLDREQGYTIRLFTDTNVQQAVDDYNAVYNKSWKANELYGEFIEGLAYRLAEQGWLRLAILYIGGKAAAAQFWFVVHGRASIFKLAYDEDWKHYSPGSILTCYLMEHVIDSDKVSEIDFLTGNDSYKQDWMSERRERSSLSFINTPESGARAGRLINWLRKLI
ncbi:MAG: GNAT family N-acetyltransferase [Gammaproteobacteria bacterium]|nr:GNAT family N-acetyltransferase [Gammaproteobacteria bacterium]